LYSMMMVRDPFTPAMHCVSEIVSAPPPLMNP
jgi:hypothetical protein